MLDLAVSILFGALAMWAVVTLWFGVHFSLFLRSVNKHSEGLRLAPLRDRDHDRKLY